MTDGLEWLPPEGVALSTDEVRRILIALRALISEALERQKGEL